MGKDTREKFDIFRIASENPALIRKPLITVSGIGIIGCIILLFPQVRGAIFALGEHIINRQLLTADYWNRSICRIAINGLFVFCALLIITFRQFLRIQVRGGVIIFIYLIVQLIITIPSPENASELILQNYYYSYRQGFSLRMFIGTIVDFLSGGNFITRKFIWLFITVSTVLYCFFQSVLLGYLIDRQQEKKSRILAILFVIIYLSCFTSPLVYFDSENFGRMEMYVLIFMMGIITLIDKKYWCLLVPVLCLFSIATHLLIVPFYMPLVFILLLYKVFENSINRKSTICLFIITISIIITSVAYFVLFSKNTLVFPNEQAYLDYLVDKIDLPTKDFSIHSSFYQSIEESIENRREYIISSSKENILFPGIFSILLNIPIFLLFMYLWIHSFLNEQRKPKKLIFILAVLMPFISIPVFLIFHDWGRYVTMVMTSQFILLFYFFYRKEASVLYASELIFAGIKRHSFVFTLLCILTLFIGPLLAISPSFVFMALVKIFKKLFLPFL